MILCANIWVQCLYTCVYTSVNSRHTHAGQVTLSAPALYNCITVPPIQTQWTLLSSLMQWTSSQMIWDGSHFQIKCNLVSTDISNFGSFLLSCNTQIVWRERGGHGIKKIPPTSQISTTQRWRCHAHNNPAWQSHISHRCCCHHKRWRRNTFGQPEVET